MAGDLKASIRITLRDEVNASAKRITASLSELNAKAGNLGQLGGRASAAVTRLTTAQQAARAEAQRLTTKLTQLQASGTASQAEIAQLSSRIAQLSAVEAQAAGKLASFEGRLDRVGATGELTGGKLSKLEADILKLSAASNQAAARMERMSKSSAKAAVSAKAVETATGQAGKRFGRITKEQRASNLAYAEGINLTTELAFGAFMLNKRTQGLGIALAGAGNNAFSFARFLGPVGMTIGTLATAVPGLIGMFTNWGNKADKAADKTKQLNNASATTARFFKGIKLNVQGASEETQHFLSLIDGFVRDNESAARRDRLLRGEGSVAETEAAIKAAELQRTGRGARSVEEAKKSTRGLLEGAKDTITSKILDDGGLEDFAYDLDYNLAQLTSKASIGQGRIRDPQALIRQQLLTSAESTLGPGASENQKRTVRKEAGDAFDELVGESKELREAFQQIKIQSERAVELRDRQLDLQKGLELAKAREEREAVRKRREAVSDRLSGLIDGGRREYVQGGGKGSRFDKAVERARDGDPASLRKLVDPEAFRAIVALMTKEQAIATQTYVERIDTSNQLLRELGYKLDDIGSVSGRGPVVFGGDDITATRTGAQ